MIEEAAAYGGDNQTDARFALILLYNREKRYDDALKQLATLRERYPRNRLVWLESGSTALRAGRAADAERFLSEGLARFADDRRPRMFGEDALWHYKRGAAFAGTRTDGRGRGGSAEAPRRSRAANGSTGARTSSSASWRSRPETGPPPRVELRAAIPLADSDNDPLTSDEARRLLK